MEPSYLRTGTMTLSSAAGELGMELRPTEACPLKGPTVKMLSSAAV